jgi:hypothetical protein
MNEQPNGMSLLIVVLASLLVACDQSFYDANLSFRAMANSCGDETFTVRRVDDGDLRTITITCKPEKGTK